MGTSIEMELGDYTMRIAAATLLLLLFASFGLQAQPDWVKLAAKNANAAKTHDDAVAVTLYDVTELEITKKGEAKGAVKLAHKILKSDGEHFAVQRVPVFSFVEMKDLKGWIVRSNGKVDKLKKEHTVQVGTSESKGYYDDVQWIVSALPNPEVGDIVAFEFTLKETGWTSLYHQFVFQRQVPVQYSAFRVKLPDGWQLRAKEHNMAGIEKNQIENTHSWTAKDLPYQPKELLAPSWGYLSRRLEITCFQPGRSAENNFPDWQSVASWAHSIHSEPAYAGTGVIAKTVELIGGATTFEDKLRAVAGFSQKDIRYVAVEIGKGGWVPRPADVTIRNRFGDCKDKTTLMRAMLKSIGIASASVLANPTNPVYGNLPTPFQFNHCIIGIPIKDEDVTPTLANAVVDNWLFFDPTEDRIRLGELPWSLQGSRVLVASPDQEKLIYLPYPKPQAFHRILKLDGELKPDGSIEASVSIDDVGARAFNSRAYNETTSTKDQLEGIKSWLDDNIPGISISDYKIIDVGDTSSTRFIVSSKNYLQKAGNLTIFKPDIFRTVHVPELKKKTRHHPIWFGGPNSVVTDLRWKIPGDWNADVDTSMVFRECDAASITARTSLDNDLLHFKSTYLQEGYLMEQEDYKTAKRFSKMLSRIRETSIIFNK